MAGAWIAIRTFDPRRHPSCLAAALISDAVYRAFHAENRRQVQRETVSEVVGDQPSAIDEHDLHALRQVLIEARTAGLDPLDVEVVRRVIVGGSTEAVAAELGVTARAVRYRCTRVVAELARFTEIGDLRPAG
jgi:DNA-directed RNA polymerase specialized sigma24 family protein